MTSVPTITWKRGDTFEAECTYKNDVGGAVDLDGITITSQFRLPRGVLISDADVEIVSPASSGVFRVIVADTDDWPTGILEWDIQYRLDGGSIVSSDTILVNVVRDVTRP